MTDITPIVSAVLTIVAALITTFVIPYLKSKLSEQKRKRIKEYVDVAVQAAEQLFPTVDGEKLGKEKLEYVAECLAEKGISFNVDDIYDDVRVLIEAAVKQFCQ